MIEFEGTSSNFGFEKKLRECKASWYFVLFLKEFDRIVFPRVLVLNVSARIVLNPMVLFFIELVVISSDFVCVKKTETR